MHMASDTVPSSHMDMDCEHCETMSYCQSGFSHCMASPALINQVLRPAFIPGHALVNTSDVPIRLSAIQTSLYRPPISA